MIEFIKRFKFIIPEFIWEYFRLRSILNSHVNVSAYWDRVIDKYINEEIEKVTIQPKKKIENSEKIIWQYWGQGFNKNDIPEIVQMCFDSVDEYKGRYTVIRLCDESLSEYIELPQYVMKKYKDGVFGKAHFSDLVRLAILHTYGGVWLDATILLTAPLKDMLKNNDWFMYQRDWNQEDKKKWRRTYAYYFSWNKNFKVRLLNSVIYANKNTIVISDFFQLLLYYWKTECDIKDYFFFQILFTQYMAKYPDRNCSIVSDCLPNMLQMYITGTYRKYAIPEILKMISIHKLSYKSISAEDLKNLLYPDFIVI